MLCPNCGRVLDEIEIRCKYCGNELSKGQGILYKEKTSTDLASAPDIQIKNDKKDKYLSGRWVGPRRVGHICAIVAGLGAAYNGYLLCAFMELLQAFSADISGMQAGIWAMIFGVVLMILGIVGLIKIHSDVCCAVLGVLYLVVVLPFWYYKELLIPGTGIFIAFWVSLSVMALSGSAMMMKKEGNVSGWITLAILVAIGIFANVSNDKTETGYDVWRNEAVQNGNKSAQGMEQEETAAVTPTPDSIGADSIYNWQNEENDLYDYDYYDDYDDEDDDEDDDYGEDEEIDDDELEEEDSEYIFPNSGFEYLTAADVKGMSARELNLAKNELYARHGRIFDREDLQEYFEECSWYEPLYTRKEWDEKGDKYFFNQVEIKNRNFLVKREEKAKK